VDVEVAGERHAVDTGFIVYNEPTYPLFTRLLRKLGVATRESDMSLSVQCAASGLEWSSRAFFAQRRNLLRPSHWKLLREVLRFHREARSVAAGEDDKVTLGDFLLGAGFSRDFAVHYALPMATAIWSASPRSIRDFPARTLFRFFENHGLLELASPIRWRTIEGGSRRYVEALSAPFADRIRLSAPVQRLRRCREGVEVRARGMEPERFDHVVLAVHSDQALALIEAPRNAEREILASVPYEENRVVLHTDASVLPRCRRARASWNVHLPRESEDRVSVTYDMNRLQGLSTPEPLLVSLNRSEAIDAQRVLARFTYHHPVFDSRALAAQRLRGRIDGADRIHFCGAWWGHGFHEDGVRSALDVGRRFGGEL
jgi:uncharacterized protein